MNTSKDRMMAKIAAISNSVELKAEKVELGALTDYKSALNKWEKEKQSVENKINKLMADAKAIGSAYATMLNN